jgi:hypothetical protein
MKKHLLILAAALLSISPFAQIPNYVPSNGLVGWWPFNGNANDESGNGNNGTVNGATLANDRFGNASSAYSFDGVDDFINVINPSILNFSVGTNFSVSFLYNPLGVVTNLSGFNGLVSRMHGNPGAGPGDGWQIGRDFNNYRVEASDLNQQGCAPILNSVIINSWVHVVLIFDRINGQIKYFSNGALIEVIFCQGITNSFVNNYDLKFGVERQGQQYSSGSLDDIGIWNRALTECEIQDLYHAQLGSQAISAGPDQSICAGDNVTLNGAGGSNYQWNNNVVDGQAFAPAQSNSYVVTAQDTLGCTGTDTVVVTVLENANSTLTQTALDSYTLNGQTYTQSGIYTQVIPGANGCDSTITLNLTLNFTGMDELGTGAKKLVNITDLNGKIIPRRKNTLMLFIYEDGTVERVVEMEE